MCETCAKSDLTRLEAVFREFEGDEHALISILQKAQEIYGYLPTDVIYAVAEHVGVSPAKVMGVATFYTQFRLQPVGKNLIMLCKGTACRGSRGFSPAPSGSSDRRRVRCAPRIYGTIHSQKKRTDRVCQCVKRV